MADALDAPGLNWSTGGDAEWASQTLENQNGADAAQSGLIGDDSETWLETSVRGPGVLNFWWKVSSESGFDHLDVAINGQNQGGRLSGEVEWTQRSLTLGEGLHQIRWTYSKDSSDQAGADAAWLDDVSYIPDGPVNTLDANDLTEVGAMLNGKINPNGLPTSAVFQYGTSTSYGSTITVSLSPNNGTSAQNVSATLAGLLPGTTYHFRLVATNDSNPPPGANMTFTTLSPFVYSKNGQEISIVRYTGSVRDVVIPALIEGLPVTRIDSNAFESRRDVTSVSLPNSLRSIGEYAFDGCDGLTSVTLPSGMIVLEEGAFYQCANLQSITISSSVISLGSWVFAECGSLTSVAIPSSVNSIGAFAFSGCAKLSNVTLPEGLLAIEDGTFRGCGKLGGLQIPNTVSRIGSSAFYQCSSLAGLVIPQSVETLGESVFSECVSLTSIVLPSALASIESGTFEGCSKLASVAIPSTVTRVGSNAFSNCTRLAGITLPAGITSLEFGTFRNCSSLLEMIIPQAVESIHDYAFAKCVKLASVTLSSGLTGIGYSAFEGCSALTNVVIPPSLTTLGGYAFANCVKLSSISLPSGLTQVEIGTFEGCFNLSSVVLPTSVTSIGRLAFSNCRQLTSIVLPDSVLSLGAYAFADCIKLSSVVLSPNLTIMDDGVFSGCVSLTTIAIPNGVTRIGEDAFLECYKLTQVVIPATVRWIGSSAFADCRSLTSIAIPLNVTWIGDSAFLGCRNLDVITVDALNSNYGSVSGVLFDKVQSVLIKCPDSKSGAFVIPASVLRIESGAFSDCRKLTSVSIPSGVFTIGDGAFQGCLGLTSMVIPDSVAEIGESAFENCCKLISLTISKQLTEIPELAFAGCSSLTSVTLPEGVSSIGYQAFFDCAKLVTVDVPSSLRSIDDYAFAFCGSLLQVSIPKDVVNIGFGAFSACGKLASISVDPLNAIFSDIDGVLFDKERVVLLKMPEAKSGSYAVPSGVIRIGNSAFRYSSALTSVTLPESLTGIGDSAFRHCRSLTKIVIPKGVEQIGDYAFSGCSALSRVVLSEDTDEIGVEAFSNCTNLKSITIPEEVDEIGNRAFAGSGLTHVFLEGDAPEMGEDVFYPLSSASFMVHYLDGSRGYAGSSWLGYSAVGMAEFAPEIAVEESVDVNLQDGVGSLSFGSVLVSAQVSKNIVIRNLGTSDLSGLVITSSGTHSADYLVEGLGEPTLAPGESTTFTLVFKPSEMGTRTAEIQISSNDADESPFNIALTGIGTRPEISVREAKELTHKKSTVSFGSATIGKTVVTKKFTIKNVGTATLSGLATTKNGTHAAEYTISSLSKTSLSAGASATFTITFKPTVKGTRTATIYIASNDADENPFTFKLTASALSATKVKKISLDLLATKDVVGTKIIKPTLNEPRIGVLVIDGQKYKTITFPDSLGREDVTRLAEVSSNLVDWGSGKKHTTLVSRHNGLIKVRDNVPSTPEAKRYIRLRRVNRKGSGWKF